MLNGSVHRVALCMLFQSAILSLPKCLDGFFIVFVFLVMTSTFLTACAAEEGKEIETPTKLWRVFFSFL